MKKFNISIIVFLIFLIIFLVFRSFESNSKTIINTDSFYPDSKKIYINNKIQEKISNQIPAAENNLINSPDITNTENVYFYKNSYFIKIDILDKLNIKYSIKDNIYIEK